MVEEKEKISQRWICRQLMAAGVACRLGHCDLKRWKEKLRPSSREMEGTVHSIHLKRNCVDLLWFDSR